MLRFTDDNEILREDSYRGIVAGVQWRGDIERSMDELEGLCEADGIQVVGRLAHQPAVLIPHAVRLNQFWERQRVLRHCHPAGNRDDKEHHDPQP